MVLPLGICYLLHKMKIMIVSTGLLCELHELTAHSLACCEAQIMALVITHTPLRTNCERHRWVLWQRAIQWHVLLNHWSSLWWPIKLGHYPLAAFIHLCAPCLPTQVFIGHSLSAIYRARHWQCRGDVVVVSVLEIPSQKSNFIRLRRLTAEVPAK